jgi:glycerol-3-phosphate dehydrogenase
LLATKPTCQTEHLPIIGSAGYDENGARALIEEHGFEEDIAAYLNRTYGDQAERVAALASEGYDARLVEGHPVIEAEVVFATRYEMAERVIDVLARRMPLALLDSAASRKATPRVLEIMAQELGWGEERCSSEQEWTEQRLTKAL